MDAKKHSANPKGTMTTEATELDEQKTAAVRRISDSIGTHQFVKREEGIGFSCRNHVCASKGTVFLTLKDRYDHQAIVAVNDLLSSLRFERELDLGEEGVPEAAMEEDFTYSLLTDLLDATPAGRSYADRRATQEARAVSSAMEAAEADSDAISPARSEILNQLQKRYGVSTPTPSNEARSDTAAGDLLFARFLPEAKEAK